MDRGKRQLVDPNDIIAQKVEQLMTIEGEPGLGIKTCLLGGLTKDEAISAYSMEQCSNSGHCECQKLYTIERKYGVSVIILNWGRNHHGLIYFAILPTILWQRFRDLTSFNEVDVRVADKIAKEASGVQLSCLSKIFYSIMRKTMDCRQIDVLVGKASPCAAKCLLISELDDLVDNYIDAWQQVGLVLPVL
jgi:hypothetical protein